MTAVPDKSASELWAALTTLPRPNREVTFPRKHPVTKEPLPYTVAVWVLTEAELMRARAAADGYAKEMLANPQKSGDANLGYQEIFRNECIVEVVCMACRDPKNLAVPSFPNPKLARQFMTSDEFLVLFQAYCDFQEESGPIVSHMTKEEMNGWLDRLGEGASLAPLAALSSDARNRLLLHSASLLRQSRTGSGSPGSPPDGSSSEANPLTPGLNESLSSKPASFSPADVADAERPGPVQLDDV